MKLHNTQTLEQAPDPLILSFDGLLAICSPFQPKCSFIQDLFVTEINLAICPLSLESNGIMANSFLDKVQTLSSRVSTKGFIVAAAEGQQVIITAVVLFMGLSQCGRYRAPKRLAYVIPVNPHNHPQRQKVSGFFQRRNWNPWPQPLDHCHIASKWPPVIWTLCS